MKLTLLENLSTSSLLMPQLFTSSQLQLFDKTFSYHGQFWCNPRFSIYHLASSYRKTYNTGIPSLFFSREHDTLFTVASELTWHTANFNREHLRLKESRHLPCNMISVPKGSVILNKEELVIVTGKTTGRFLCI